jgi:hypothetical protein
VRLFAECLAQQRINFAIDFGDLRRDKPKLIFAGMLEYGPTQLGFAFV